MKIDWKSLSFAMIFSIIVNGVAGIVVLVDYTERISNVFDALVSEISSEEEVSITIAEGSVIPLWIWIVIFVYSLVVLTIIFYFVIGYLNKRRK